MAVLQAPFQKNQEAKERVGVDRIYTSGDSIYNSVIQQSPSTFCDLDVARHNARQRQFADSLGDADPKLGDVLLVEEKGFASGAAKAKKGHVLGLNNANRNTILGPVLYGTKSHPAKIFRSQTAAHKPP